MKSGDPGLQNPQPQIHVSSPLTKAGCTTPVFLNYTVHVQYDFRVQVPHTTITLSATSLPVTLLELEQGSISQVSLGMLPFGHNVHGALEWAGGIEESEVLVEI